MRTIVRRSLGWALLVTLLLLAAGAPAGADGSKPVATSADRIAIKGYDTVAYFTDGKATKGSSDIEYLWDDAKWQFASASHRDMFIADPDRYAPQFGGFCTGAIGFGELLPANPEIWTIVDGKLYMSSGAVEDFAAASIERAKNQWPAVQDRWAARSQ